MSGQGLTLLSLFVAGALSIAILLAALLAALLLSQRRRIALERFHAQRILAAQEDERSRVARELHDDALQRLAAIRHELDDAGRLSGQDLLRRFHGIAGELEDLATVLRTAAHQLHPSVVEKAGLVRALGDLAAELGRTSGLAVRLSLPAADTAVPPTVGVAAYRIAQEALRNVVRHAGVAQADLVLETDPRGLTVRIADSGKGLDAGRNQAADGLGLIAMRQRAAALGGRLTISSRPSGGTVVTAVFPYGGAT